MIRLRLLLWITFVFGCVLTFGEILSEEHKLQNVSIRVRRQAPADKMKQFLDHASIIARIANGISLQSGLMDGSIPIDTAVGELLSFGDVKISDIIQFKPENMNSLAEKLKGLPKSLDSSVKEVEDGVVAMNKLREDSEKVGDVTKFPKKDEYFNALKAYKKGPLVLGPLADAIDALKQVSTLVTSIEEKNIDEKTSDAGKKSYISLFGTLETQFEYVKEKLDLVKPISLDEFKVLPESKSIFAPIPAMLKLIMVRQNITARSTSETIEIVRDNFQQINDLKTILTTSNEDISKLDAICKSRAWSKPMLKVYTGGFPKGVSDLKQLGKDAQDPWFQTITGGKVSLEKLSSSLEPLLKIGDLLKNSDEKLLAISTDNFSKSITYLKSVLATIVPVPDNLGKLADEFTKLDACTKMGKHIVPDDYALSEKAIKNVNIVGDLFKNLDTSLKNIENTKTKMTGFSNFIGFTDVNNQQTSLTQVLNVFKTIRTTDKMKNFKNMIQEMSKGFSLDPKKLGKNIDDIIKAEKDIIPDALPEEASIHKCLKEQSNLFAKILPIIGLTQNLRLVDASKFADLETIISAVSSVSAELTGVKSIPENMKKVNKPEVLEVNKFPNISITSDIIQVSVMSLQNSYSLKNLKQEILDLKSVEPLVTKAIGTIKDKNVQQSIIANWGDHSKDIIALEGGIGQIEAISNNLQEPKTLTDYGNPFPELSKISDIKIDSSKKIQTLDTLIPLVQDPTEFEKNKKTLEKIDSLDLGFSRHSSKLMSAKSAFNSLFNFLAQFSLAPVTKTPPAQQGPSGTGPAGYGPNNSPYGVQKEKTDHGLIWGLSGGAIILLILIAIGSFYLYKYLRKRVNKKSLIKWIRAQYFEKDDYAAAYRYHESVMKAMEVHAGKPDMKASLAYLPAEKHRDRTERFCKVDTALHNIKKDGKKMPIHANLIESGDGVKFYATQHPICLRPGWKPAKPEDPVYEDTREDFWHMCMHDSVEFIVMLCESESTDENLSYFPKTTEKVLKFGRYELKTIGSSVFGVHKNITERKIEVKDTKGKFSKRVFTHLHYLGWPDMKIPEKGVWEPAYDMMNAVQKSKHPIVVHCVSGIGRTMAFIGLHTVSEGVKKNYEVTMSEELSKLRARRYDAIQTVRQCYWLQVAVAHKLNKDYKLGLDEELKEMFETFFQVAINHKGPAELAAKRKLKRSTPGGTGKKDSALGADTYF